MTTQAEELPGAAPAVSARSRSESIAVSTAITVVFISNMCIMVMELVASRVMAPVIGNSLYTWTSIIGVILAGISLGNYLGGIIADRMASRRVVGWIFILAGLAAFSVIPLGNWMVNHGVPDSLPLQWRIVLYTAGIFFLPSIALGLISPVLIKLALHNLDETGRVVGRVYAASAFGSIVGTFLTGFYLISAFGTRAIILGVGCVLVALGLIIGRATFFRRADGVAAALLILGPLVIFGSEANSRSVSILDQFDAFPTHRCLIETNYYCIRWYDTKIGTPEESIRVLVLDHLIHSYNSLESPLSLHYAYERSYADLMEKAPVEGQRKLLVLGGGGYTFPRYVEAKYPGSDIHVVEIDPGVTNVAMNHMEMLPDTKIRTTNMDARQYLETAPAGEKYNLILGDAFNDFSVPFHLTTQEFTQLVADHMTDDGLYLANVIDSGDAPFLSAYTRTIGQVFPYVYIIPNIPSWRTNLRNTFVIVGSKRDLAPYIPTFGSDAQVLTPDEQAAMLRDTARIILTDDYVPTDNLLAPVFAASGF
ncbi:MAG: fused MFS/spermidine synthase [Anaerolineae bacterium]